LAQLYYAPVHRFHEFWDTAFHLTDTQNLGLAVIPVGPVGRAAQPAFLTSEELLISPTWAIKSRGAGAAVV